MSARTPGDAQLHARASELFVTLLARAPAERAAELERVAREDPALASEVSSLLAHHVEDSGADVPPARASARDDALPTRIGPYRVLARIGRGGSGQVFLAEQDEPVRRRVAIKVVPLATVSAEAAARFELERRALESTDHPNITRVLDAGRTPDGLPYLVMNLVEGQPITEHAAAHALDLGARVRLVLDVADAVQHAHQRGVIHRDLKPANVLVTEIDGRAVPQVLDFGIAKPVLGVFQGESPPTLGLPMGTPAYMAPEQTGLAPVDTRADVYALGALLYELVAGAPPIELLGDPLEDLRRVRELAPPPASRVRASHPRGAPGAASRAFLDDLDVVLAKALEKEPERRYASAGALIDDLRRLLLCEPIAARRPTWSYRAARFAQRNRALVLAASAVVAALALGIAGLAAGLVEARRQRVEALEQRDAQREINRFLTDDLLAGAAPDRGGANLPVLELLHRASEHVDERFPDRPRIAAAVHHSLGESFAQLGAYDDAERHLARAVELRRASAGPDDPDTLNSEIAAASLLGRRERAREAEAALVPLIERARKILGPEDPALYAALNDLGVVLVAQERSDEALAPLIEALEGRRRLLGASDPQVVVTLSNLAQAHDAKGDTAVALAMLLEALRALEASHSDDRMTLLGLENNIGATLQDLERDREAEPHLRRAAELASELLGPEHPATLSIQCNLAGLESDLGEPARAIELYARVVDQRTAQLGASADDTLVARHGYWNAVWKAGRAAEAADGFAELARDVEAALGVEHSLAAQTESSLARALYDSGRASEALVHAERAESRLRALYGSEHARTRTAAQLIATIRGSGLANSATR